MRRSPETLRILKRSESDNFTDCRPWKSSPKERKFLNNFWGNALRHDAESSVPNYANSRRTNPLSIPPVFVVGADIQDTALRPQEFHQNFPGPILRTPTRSTTGHIRSSFQTQEAPPATPVRHVPVAIIPRQFPEVRVL